MNVEIEERPSYYSIIPATVRYDEDLKANEKLLFGEISSLCNKNGYCYATNDYFSKLYKVHKNTISIWINNLQKKGYITSQIVYKKGTKEIDKRILCLGRGTIREIAEIYCENHEPPINENSDTYQQKHGYPINENSEENNTSINNHSYYSSYNKSLFQMIEENFGRPISPIEYEEISSWEDTDLTRYAIKEAVLNGIYSIKYISKILYQWKQKNIQTVQEAQKDNQEFEKKKKAKSERPHYKSKYEREEEAMRNFLEADDD